MNKKIISSFVIVAGFVAIFSFLLYRNITLSNQIQYVKIAGQNIKIEFAVTPEAQAKGLSGRQGLNENEGMLFIFENPGRHPFWMKDMNFAIDIIWLDEEGKIVYIQKNATPESYPEVFGGEVPSKYVLEVASGFSEKNNLKVGDKIQFLRSKF